MVIAYYCNLSYRNEFQLHLVMTMLNKALPDGSEVKKIVLESKRNSLKVLKEELKNVLQKN